jgi:hypothetical protein
MLYFLLLQWLRKDVTLLCSSLTIDPRPYNYTLRTNYRNIECAVGRLTSGIRRAYLANANVWHRKAVEPRDAGAFGFARTARAASGRRRSS